MPSYILAVIDYRASDNNGAFEWSITGAHGQQPPPVAERSPGTAWPLP